jgi:hypothetical protein
MHDIIEKRERLGEYHRLCVEPQSHEVFFLNTVLSYVLLIVVQIISVTKVIVPLFFLL